MTKSQLRYDDLLQLFGTDAARARFVDLCRHYYIERVRQESAEQRGEPVVHSCRAEVHNQIMEIVQKLFLRLQERMPSRTEVGNMIMEYYRANHGHTERLTL